MILQSQHKHSTRFKVHTTVYC